MMILLADLARYIHVFLRKETLIYARFRDRLPGAKRKMIVAETGNQ